MKWTKLSCRTFKDNQTRLQLFALAYNLANFLRRLALPKSIRQWSLTTLREKLVKIGAKVTRHSKYVSSNWRRSPCRDNCSQRFWSGSDDWRCRPRCVYRKEAGTTNAKEAMKRLQEGSIAGIADRTTPRNLRTWNRGDRNQESRPEVKKWETFRRDTHGGAMMLQ